MEAKHTEKQGDKLDDEYGNQWGDDDGLVRVAEVTRAYIQDTRVWAQTMDQ